MPKAKKSVAKTKKTAKKIKATIDTTPIVEGFLWDTQCGEKPKSISDIQVTLPGDPYGDYGERYINRAQSKKNIEQGSLSNKMAGWSTLEEAKKGLPEYISALSENDSDYETVEKKRKYTLYHIRIERIATAEANTHIQHDVTIGEIKPIEAGTIVVVSDKKKKAKKKIKKSAKGKLPEAESAEVKPPEDSEFTTPDLG